MSSCIYFDVFIPVLVENGHKLVTMIYLGLVQWTIIF